jgi:hypothetical protein
MTKAKGCPVMTSESKILTVSYGTFSCTLEGFENPFDTMKAIAEYFRDLAAQDRHFGAEPPPPDAAMLHRLAEREVSRLAAAKQAAAPAGDVDAETAEPAVAPRIQFNPVTRRSSGPMVEPTPAVEDAASTPEPSLQDAMPDGVAAKLARIRRSVQPAQADLAAPAAAFVADATDGDDALVADAPISETPEADAAEVEVEVDAVVEAEVALAEVEVEQSPDVAARLGELIASEDTSAEPVLTDETAAEVWTDSEAALDALTTTDDASFELDAVALDETETAAEDLADLAALDGVAFDEAALAAALDDSLPEEMPADLALADLAAIDPLPEAVIEVAEAEEVAEAAPEAPVEVEAPAPVAKSGRSRRVHSRVIRLHPEDAPTETPRDMSATRVLSRQEESDEVARLMHQADEVMAEEENRRRHEALSRLKAAVASTEADRADVDYQAPRPDANLDPYRDDLAEAIQPDEPAPPAAPPEVKPRRKSVSIRTSEPRPGTIRPGMIGPPPLVLVSEQRIDRVAPGATPAPAAVPVAAPSMAPAVPGIAPSNPEGQPMVALRTGRLSGAIGAGAAAAVAAPARNIVLEKPSYGPATDAEEDEDLAEDVREIDEAGFASFAETVGAKSMAEMLEAAAAYATCIEKRGQFTRPQLMRRMMASAGGKPVSREDGLRSFGTLLRTGRIEKVTRGHYSLAETSHYLTEARRLG